jgi:hypothetical protein
MLLLVTLGALSGTGCLIAEAPDYGAPRRTTPIIDRLSVFPEPAFMVELYDDEPKPFVMTIFSEDAGEDVVGSVVLNYGTNREERFLTVRISPRAADQPKEMRITLRTPDDVAIPKGCHSLTVFVMHFNSYDILTDLPRNGSDGDVATVTWWLDANKDQPGSPLPCPTAGTL